MNNPRRDLTAEYNQDNVEACEKVLRSLLSAIGTRWRERIVVVGGMVPFYLYDDEEVPEDLDPHIGTIDVDIGIGILVDEGDEEAYTELERQITALGFRLPEPDKKWRWARDVDGVTVLLEFLGPVNEGDVPGRQTTEPIGGTGNLYALAVRGIELVPRDCVGVELEGDTLNHAGRRAVTGQVANLLPFLMLKAFAIEEREKFKDSYDVVWSLLAHPEGPAGAARLAAGSSIALHGTVGEAIDLLRTHYETPEHIGPARFAEFELSRLGREGDEDLRERLRRDAHGAVTRFLDQWGEITREG